MPNRDTGREVPGACPEESLWLRYLDGDATLPDPVLEHLNECPRCRARLAEAADLAAWSQGLDHGRPVAPPRPRRWGSVAAAAAAVLMVLAIVWAPSRAALAQVLDVLQVKQVQGVPVSQQQMRALLNTLSQGGTVSLAYYGSVSPMTSQKVEIVPAVRLPQVAGLPDLWPAELGTAESRVTTANRVTFRLNVPHINQLIAATGGHQFFPMALNGVPFVLNVPVTATMTASHGAVTYGLAELRQPTLAVPGNVNAMAVRNAILSLPFLPPSLARAISSLGNWRDTLVLPLIGQSRNVLIHGRPAVLEVSPHGHALGVVWEQNGVLVVFGVESQGVSVSPNEFLQEVDRLFP
jgi:hypothetical protein